MSNADAASAPQVLHQMLSNSGVQPIGRSLFLPNSILHRPTSEESRQLNPYVGSQRDEMGCKNNLRARSKNVDIFWTVQQKTWMEVRKLICTCLLATVLGGLGGSMTIAASVVDDDPANGPTSYSVTVNTSSLMGLTGYIDLQFNGNLAAGDPTANLQLSNFVTDGALNATDPYNETVGDVSGALPGGVLWGNSSSDSEYTEAISFGSYIGFNLTFTGPALDSYNANTGDAFVLDFINSAQNGYLLCADPDLSDPTNYYGYLAGVINIGPNTTNQTVAITPIAGPGPDEQPNSLSPAVVSFSLVPEPGSMSMLTLGLVLAGLVLRRRQRGSASAQ